MFEKFVVFLAPIINASVSVFDRIKDLPQVILQFQINIVYVGVNRTFMLIVQSFCMVG